MPSVTQRKKKQIPESRRRFRIRPAYVVLLLLMGFFAFKFVQKTEQIKSLTAQEIALQQQNRALETDRTNTQAAIRGYRSPQYVENTARSVLGYTKPGETLVQLEPTRVVVEHFRPAPVSIAPPAQVTWKQWWSAFFG
jgi:cell division protein FtsB